MTSCINKQLRQKALAYVRHELGAVICWDQEERERAVELLRDAGRVFRAEIMNETTPVVLLYLYRQYEQAAPELQGKYGVVDGLASIRNENGKRYAVIGLAVEALHREDASEYMPLVFLHELTHVIAPAEHAEHGPEFHAVLDQLIARYNQATGATVKNDYCA